MRLLDLQVWYNLMQYTKLPDGILKIKLSSASSSSIIKILHFWYLK